MISEALVEQAEQRVLAALPRRLGQEALAAALDIPVPVLRHAFLVHRHGGIDHALRRLRVMAAWDALQRHGGQSERAVAHHYGFRSLAQFRRACRWTLGEIRPGAAPPSMKTGFG